ncbi:excisionase family DNA-binding protein [Aliihoeflea aestuarii]|jgi:excisionase family DNA binding protein|uniref:helix-turn-helix domain-containing protein n=1 Tax=Aliihoeflea aestuarii TaxID=453840 RepID=UPI002092EEC4|nr:helix-turn-helix domain-containing protein [Aliihoeflea aestuarii]MCO6390566.1 excisionase family DNA-binding protein [Aliihoeflea aestuarii]
MSDEDLPNVFTPKTLAERWHCSERHIRNMLERGDLDFFRLGGKLVRIRTEDVVRYENASINAKPSRDL